MARLYSRWSSGQLVVYAGNDGPGDEWFVSSADGSAGNNGKDWEHALTTIDAAVNLSAVGDTIYVAPDHAENLAADSAVDLDVAGVRVVGIVRGRQMPTLTVTATAGDFKLAAAGCTLENMRFLGGIDVITGCIEVSAADCAILNCEYRDVTGQATDVIITTNAAERLLIDGYRHIGAAASGANSAIAIVGAVDSVEIRNFDIYGNFAVGAIDVRTGACTLLNIHDGDIWTENAADIGIIDTITGSTGKIGPNIRIRLQDDADNLVTAVTGATFHIVGDVQVVNANAEKSIPIPWNESAEA